MGLVIRSGVTALAERGRVSKAERECRGRLNDDRVSRRIKREVVWTDGESAIRGEKFQF